jgi:hypothetical protein
MSTPLLTARFRHLITLLIGAVLFAVFAGCASAPDRRYEHSRRVTAPDVYVYYPAYEVYYNSTRREYVYYEGNSWVARREPPRRFARELQRAPWVRLDFNDAPERHHADVVRRYPRTWSGRSDDGSRDDRHDGRRN